jgi:formate hydrogenlyase subunit 6/NADH:ubiquinone oxidoreductase subunit I
MQQAGTMTINKTRVGEWVAQLVKQATVIAPIIVQNREPIFSQIFTPEEIAWVFFNPLSPAKQFVLPQTEPIVAINRRANGYTVGPVYDERRRIIFNVRSCDVRGIAFLTKMHASDLPDDSYVRRISNTILISLACNQPCPRGFCICFDAGPFLHRDYDIQLTDLGECLLAEPGTPSGAELLTQASALFRAATEEEIEQRQGLEAKAKTRFGDETAHFGSAMRRISTGRVEEALWDKIGDWCLECGGCNFICPTCYCFSVKDRAENGGWLRCKTWDSCQYAAFTTEATGHNPRAEHKERVKRRFFHKVSAQYYKRDAIPGCVGCGRCITVCMGTAHMPAVVAAVRKGVWHG